MYFTFFLYDIFVKRNTGRRYPVVEGYSLKLSTSLRGKYLPKATYRLLSCGKPMKCRPYPVSGLVSTVRTFRA